MKLLESIIINDFIRMEDKYLEYKIISMPLMKENCLIIVDDIWNEKSYVYSLKCGDRNVHLLKEEIEEYLAYETQLNVKEN